MGRIRALHPCNNLTTREKTGWISPDSFIVERGRKKKGNSYWLSRIYNGDGVRYVQGAADVTFWLLQLNDEIWIKWSISEWKSNICQMTKVAHLCCSKCTRCSSGVTLPSSCTLDFLFQDGHDEVVLRHEVVLHHETSEAVTQESLVLWERDDLLIKCFYLMPFWLCFLANCPKMPPTDHCRKCCLNEQ